MTDARLTLLAIPGQETHYNLACVENGERVAFALHGVSERLFIRQAIEVVGDGASTARAGALARHRRVGRRSQDR